MTEKKPNFMAAVKAAQASKAKVPQELTQQVQAAKFKDKPEKKSKK
jgi:hypothetical protein